MKSQRIKTNLLSQKIHKLCWRIRTQVENFHVNTHSMKRIFITSCSQSLKETANNCYSFGTSISCTLLLRTQYQIGPSLTVRVQASLQYYDGASIFWRISNRPILRKWKMFNIILVRASHYSDYRLLGCDTVESCRPIARFPTNILVPSSVLKYVSSRISSVTSACYKESGHEIQEELFFVSFLQASPGLILR